MKIQSLLIVPAVLVLIGAGCQSEYVLGNDNAQGYAEEILGNLDTFPKNVGWYLYYSYPEKQTRDEINAELTALRDTNKIDNVENVLVTATEDGITPTEEAKGMASYSRATGTFTCGKTGEPVPFTLDFGWVKNQDPEHGVIDGENAWQLVALDVGSCK